MKTLFNPVKNSRLLKYPYGNVYQLFGENVELYKKAINTNGHNGIDLVSAQGTPILSSKGIVVNVADNPKGYGKHIRILTDPEENGDSFDLVYAHLDNIKVKLWDKVEDGQEIGGMGNTGFVISGNTPYWGNAPAGKGVHLHFGARPCQKTGNPEWEIYYPEINRRIFFKEYNNGFFGYVNPMALLEADTALTQYASGLILSLKKKLQELLGKVGKISK